MSRLNEKYKKIDFENSIKKSNELSMAKMNQGLSLNQMQLFAYAIFSTQKDGKTEFRKHEFEKKFDISQLRPNDAMDDAERLLDLKIKVRDLNNETGRGHNVFTDYYYDKGEFIFKWNPGFIPHILELKEKYITTDLTITSQFRSSFSWILYDYLKALYGYWHKRLPKEELMTLFNVEDVKSYQGNTALLKVKVLDLAIREMNKFTEFEVWYTEEKKGRKIVGFVIHWSIGERIAGATKGQRTLLRKIHDTVMKDMMGYLSLKDDKNLATARTHILALNEIDIATAKGLTLKQADLHIQNAKYHLHQLEIIKARDKKGDILYYNWLED